MVLSLSASLYLLVILGWIFTTLPERHSLTLPLLMTLHVFTGIASAGVTLAVGTIALKLAPEDKATPFLGVAGIATNIGAGLGPMVGGLAVDYFSSRSFAMQFSWSSPGEVFNLPVLSLSSSDFLFAIAFPVGSLSLNMLVALREEGGVQRDIALAGLTVSVAPMARAVSSLPGLNAVAAFSYGYLKRIPGADVAMGVSAYQLASSTQAAVASASRRTVASISSVSSPGASGKQWMLRWKMWAMSPSMVLNLPVMRPRSAIHGMSDHPGQVKDVSRGAVLGTIRSLAGQSVPARHSLGGAGYGAVQGAVEGGEDPGASVTAALGAARELAAELGVTSAGSCGGAGLRGHRGRHGFRRGRAYCRSRRPAR